MTDPNDRYRPASPDDQTRPQPIDPAVSPTPPASGPVDPAPVPAWSPPAATAADPAWDASPAAQPTTVVETVAQPPARRSGGGAIRWIVAALVTVLVVGAIGAVALFASKTSTAGSAGLAYVPPAAVSYLEVRLDLPGDQRQKVGDFLAHFPGFADRSTLDTGLDSVLDKLIKSASKDKYSYTGDIKPWFSGQLSVATLDLPSMPTFPNGGAAAPSPGLPSVQMNPGRIIAVVGVQDRTKAQAALDKIRADITAAGASVVSQDRSGTQIVTVSKASGGASVSYALTTDAIVLATSVDDLTAALDRKTTNAENLGSTTGFKDGIAKLRADRVGMTYLNTDGLRTMLAGIAPAGRPGSAVLSYVLTKIPSVVMSSFRFESDRIVIDGLLKAAAGATAGTSKDSGLTKHAPSDSLAYFEVADVGTFVRELVTAAKSDPALAQAGPSTQQQINQIEGILGTKLENYLDWLGNLSITGGLSDGQPAVAIIASVNDEAAATQRLTQLASFGQLAVGQAGIKIRQEDYAGTKLTLVDLPAGAGLPANSAVGFAIKDKTFYLAFGEAYLKKLLDLKPEASLGSTPRFADALKAAGGPATGGMMYVDVTAIRTLAEASMPSDQRQKYEQEIKPYLLPLDQLISVAVQDGIDTQSHFQLIVK